MHIYYIFYVAMITVLSRAGYGEGAFFFLLSFELVGRRRNSRNQSLHGGHRGGGLFWRPFQSRIKARSSATGIWCAYILFRREGNADFIMKSPSCRKQCKKKAIAKPKGLCFFYRFIVAIF